MSRPDGTAGHDALEGLRALDGPAEHDLEFSGPGDGTDDVGRPPLDTQLPGGIDHTTAAVGAGASGLVLLGIAGIFKRRWARRRYDTLDDE